MLQTSILAIITFSYGYQNTSAHAYTS